MTPAKEKPRAELEEAKLVDQAVLSPSTRRHLKREARRLATPEERAEIYAERGSKLGALKHVRARL